jgi:hypothetical protein
MDGIADVFRKHCKVAERAIVIHIHQQVEVAALGVFATSYRTEHAHVSRAISFSNF